jgi:hypothetical protein
MTAPFLFVPIFSWPAAPGGLLYCYAAGSTTPKDTYSNTAGTTVNANPVVLDDTGSATVRLGAGTYKFVLKDSTGTTTLWSADEYASSYLSAEDIGALLFPLTDAENAAPVTPAAYAAPPGNQYLGRYSSLTDAISQQDNGGAMVQSADGGIRVKGSFGGSARPEAQIIFENTATSGHCIITGYNRVNTEETAWESVGDLANGAIQQNGAIFWRWTGDDNGATTYKSVLGIHLTEYTADNCPLILHSNNSVLLGGGSTTAERWDTQLTANLVDIYTIGRARTSFVVGPNHGATAATGFRLQCEDYAQFGNVTAGAIDKALRVGYDTGSDTAFLEGYINSGSAYKDITIRGTTVILTGGDTRPGVNNSYKLGTGSYRWTEVFATNGTINTSDERLKDFEDGYSEAEVALAKALKAQIRPFRWKDKPAKVHYGASAQRVYALCVEHGIDPETVGFLDHDAELDTWGINYAELSIFILGAL